MRPTRGNRKRWEERPSSTRKSKPRFGRNEPDVPGRADDARDERRLYCELSWTWPIISPPDEYVGEAEEAATVIQTRAHARSRTLLHMGCGGGHMDATLKRYFEIVGVDLSPEMLALARQLNPEVAYLEGDMRTIRLGRPFDAVACFDSINYALTRADLSATFSTALAHLRPRGVFLTHAEETKERFRQNRTESRTRSAGDTEITFVEHSYDPDPSDTTYETTFLYLIRRAGRLQIETDRHLCGLFRFEEWLDLLGEAGFDVSVVPPRGGDPMGQACPWLVCLKPP